mgnify:CR=1 FL=1
MSASATVMESDLPTVVVVLVGVCWAAFAWLRKVC